MIFERFIVFDEDLTLDMIPLVAPYIFAAYPLLSIKDLLVLLKINLFAVIAVLALVVGHSAYIAQPEGLVVRVLLHRPESGGLTAIRHVLLWADNVLATFQMQLRLA